MDEILYDRMYFSRQQTKVRDGRQLIMEMIKKAGDLIIMPDSGINNGDIKMMIETGTFQFPHPKLRDCHQIT